MDERATRPPNSPSSGRGLRLFGHPVHSMLVHLPMGLLPAAVLADIVAIGGGGDLWWQLSFWMIVIGLAAGLPAVFSGIIDFYKIVRGTEAEDAGVIHLMTMGAALAIYAVGLAFRGGPVPGGSGTLALGFDVAGALVLSIGAYFGGKLVYDHGIGVGKH